MSSIFISYSRKDIDLAREIVDLLAENNLDTWIDWQSIPKGEDWEQEIYQGIEEAEAILFLMSPDSASSQMCNKEIAHATKNHKRIIPIVIRDTDTTDFVLDISRDEIKRRNWVFCRNQAAELPKAIHDILETIHTDYEWLKYHTRLQVRALEWDRRNHEKSLHLRGKELEEAEFQLSTTKEPYPTDLQREFVLRSRQATDRQRRLTTSIVAVAVIVLTLLSVFSFVQAENATEQASIANTAQAKAEENQRLADERANLALARQLAAQSQSILSIKDSKQMIAVLLAIRSTQLFPSATASQVLQENTLALPIAEIRLSGVNSLFSSRIIFTSNGKSVAAVDRSVIKQWDTATGRESASIGRGLFLFDFSPDGKYLLFEKCERRNGGGSCTQSSTYVWDASTREEVSHIQHDSLTTSVAFSPDGTSVVTVDRTAIRIWETLTGREMSQWAEENVQSVAITPDDKYAVSGGKDGIVRVIEIGTGEEISRMIHNDFVCEVAISPDGKYVVSGSSDNTARVWEIATGNEVAHMTHQDDVLSVAFSPDGKKVVSGSWDQTAREWDALTGTEIARMTHDFRVEAVTFSADGKHIASRDQSGNIRIWKADIDRMRVIATPDNAVISVAFSPDGKYLISSHTDKIIRVWNASTGKLVARMLHDDSITSMAISADSKYVVSGSTDYTVRVWEITTGEQIVRMIHQGIVKSVAFSPDGTYVASGGQDGTARVWETLTGREIAKETQKGSVNAVAFSADGKYVISGGDNGIVRIWESSSGKEAAQSDHDYTDSVAFVAFRADGYLAVSGGHVSTFVSIAETGEVIGRFSNSPTIGVRDVAFALSPNGNLMVLGSQDGTTSVWETTTNTRRAILLHNNAVTTAAFSSDGVYVGSGSQDGTASVWEAATGNEIAHLVRNDTVTSVAFSPDGKHIAVGSADDSVNILAYRPGDLIADACSRVTRNLTVEEWKLYFSNETYQQICPNLDLINITLRILSDSSDPNRMQSAIDNASAILSEYTISDDPGKQARKIVGDAIGEKIQYSDLHAGNLEPAINILREARNFGLEIEDATKLNSICWQGSVWGSAQDVLDYCDQAVALSPTAEEIRDSRGLARALTGDREGAIQDFQYFIETSTDTNRIAKRKQWIEDLRKGNNPFTDDILIHLRTSE